MQIEPTKELSLFKKKEYIYIYIYIYIYKKIAQVIFSFLEKNLQVSQAVFPNFFNLKVLSFYVQEYNNL